MTKVLQVLLKYYDYIQLIPELAKLVQDITLDKEARTVSAHISIKKYGEFKLTLEKL